MVIFCLSFRYIFLDSGHLSSTRDDRFMIDHNDFDVTPGLRLLLQVAYCKKANKFDWLVRNPRP